MSKEIRDMLLNHRERIENLEQRFLKYRIFFEMTNVIEKAEKEYNDLRSWIGDKYPKGKCENIIKLFQTLNEIKEVEK